MFHEAIRSIAEIGKCCIRLLSYNVHVLHYLIGTEPVLNDAAVFSKSGSTPLVR